MKNKIGLLSIITAFLLLAVFAVTMALAVHASQPDEEEEYYDLNKDGVANILDVTALLNYLSTRQEGVSDLEEEHDDLNKDGLVSILDVTALLNYLATKCNHTIVFDAAVPATCTEDGLTAGSHCEKCGKVFIAQEIVQAPGHTEEILPAVPATCAESGLTEGKKCSVCGETLVAQEVIPATGQHTFYALDAVEPTCTETGLTAGFACSVCGQVMIAQEVVPATGHTVAVEAGTAPTCLETGLTEKRYCSVCGTVLQEHETIPATGHTYKTIPAVPATCTETGLTAGMGCENCDAIFVAQNEVPALGHNYKNGVCARCGEIALQKGDIISFGTYEQDNNKSNGKEAIEWIALDVVGGKALLLSKYVLDCQPYNTEIADVTWEICTLRTWLNETFYDAAFNNGEKEKIISTMLINANNPQNDTDGGNDTTDNVFLLSYSDIINTDYGFSDKYVSDETRRCHPTEYAKAQGCWWETDRNSIFYGNCNWILRTPVSSRGIMIVDRAGATNLGYGCAVQTYTGVRPALWIDLDS